jgi:hypothetical protein
MKNHEELFLSYTKLRIVYERYRKGEYSTTLEGDYEYCGSHPEYSLTVKTMAGRTLRHWTFRPNHRDRSVFREHLRMVEGWAYQYHRLANHNIPTRHDGQPWQIRCDDLTGDYPKTICPYVVLRNHKCEIQQWEFGLASSGDGARPLPEDLKCDLVKWVSTWTLMHTEITNHGLSMKDLMDCYTGKAKEMINEVPQIEREPKIEFITLKGEQ